MVDAGESDKVAQLPGSSFSRSRNDSKLARMTAGVRGGDFRPYRAGARAADRPVAPLPRGLSPVTGSCYMTLSNIALDPSGQRETSHPAPYCATGWG